MEAIGALPFGAEFLLTLEYWRNTAQKTQKSPAMKSKKNFFRMSLADGILRGRHTKRGFQKRGCHQIYYGGVFHEKR